MLDFMFENSSSIGIKSGLHRHKIFTSIMNCVPSTCLATSFIVSGEANLMKKLT